MRDCGGVVNKYTVVGFGAVCGLFVVGVSEISRIDTTETSPINAAGSTHVFGKSKGTRIYSSGKWHPPTTLSELFLAC